MTKTTTLLGTCFAIATLLATLGTASADETRTASRARVAATRPAARRQVARRSAAPAPIENAAGTPSPAVEHAAGTPSPAAAVDTPATDSPLIRAVGGCDAASFEELAAEVGRLSAIEECTGRGDPSAARRELSRSAPRQSDLGIEEEAFDPSFVVSAQ